MPDATTPRQVTGRGPGRPLVPLGWARVSGESMRPTLAPGDRLLVRYAASVRPGDLVLARFADGTLSVKRAAERRTTSGGRQGWWLVSDDPGVGVDSRHRGPVQDQAVVAVVLARVWPRPRPARGLRPPPASGT